MTIYKRKSEQYKRYIDGVIEDYNTNGKKTLLFVTDNSYPVVDGVWRVLENYSKILSCDYEDYNVLILAPDYRGDVYVDDVPILGCKSSFSKKLGYQCSLPMFDFRMKKWLRKLKIDLIHVHSPFLCGMYARKLHRCRKIPMIATFHSQYKKDIQKSVKSKFLTRVGLKIIMRVFNASDEVWTMHEASRAVLSSYGYKGKSRLVPNATSAKPPQNREALRAKFRAEHKLQNKYVFVFVGRMVTQKGILFLAKALSCLRKSGMDFRMYYIGHGPDLRRLEEKVKELRLTDCVEFTGELFGDDLTEYYAGADLLLFPSAYDTFSLVKLEAAACRTPGVFLEDTCCGYGITNNVNGYLLPFDAEKYAQGVADIIAGGNSVQVGENAFRDLYICWKDVVEMAVGFYEELLKNKQ